MNKLSRNFLWLLLTVTLLGCNSGSSSDSPDLDSPVAETIDNFADLRLHWASYYIGDSSLPFDDQLNLTTIKINRNTATWLASYQSNNTNGLWKDLPLDAHSDEGRANLGAQLYRTYLRLFTMAKAYKLQSGELYLNAELLSTLEKGLYFLNSEYYKDGVEEWGNWWHWQLGISRVANNIMVLLYDELPATLITSYINATNYFVPNPTHLSESKGAASSSSPSAFESVGANRIHNAQVVLVRALLTNDQASFESAVLALAPVVEIVEHGDGFYLDGSFIQHTDIPYNGTYGNELLQGLGMQLGVISIAPWDIDTEYLAAIYPQIIDSFYPFLINGRMMDMVSGRAVSRLSGQNHKVGHAIINSMLFFVESAPGPIQSELKSILKSQIESDLFLDFFSNPNFYRNHQIALEITSDSTITDPDARNEHLQFPAMDRVVHHRPEWSFAIAMHSARVGNYECINKENLKGWYTADGMTYLYNQQLDHYTDYWPVINPYRLPGITSTDIGRTDCTGQLRGDDDEKRQSLIQWSGGTTLNQYGIAGFDFTNWDGTVSAKKSWFMFDDEIVAIGSDINNNTALTTIANRKISRSSVVKVNGTVIGIGETISGSLSRLDITLSEQKNPLSYILLTPQQAEVSNTCTDGNYSTIGTNTSAVSACFVQTSLEHGSSNSYQYLLMPNSTSAEVDDTIANPPVSIISNTSTVHAVSHSSLRIFGFNFWEAGAADIVTANSAMSLMYQINTDDSLTVSISDPTHSKNSLTFSLASAYIIDTDSQHKITKNDDGSFSVDISSLAGRSYQFSLNKES